MIDLKIEQKGKKLEAVMHGISRFTHLQPTLRTVAEMVVHGINENVADQKQADGGGLKQNRPGWRRFKQRDPRTKYNPGKALMHRKGRFIQRRHWAVDKIKGGFRIRPRKGNAELVAEVQAKGYVGWFGISKNTNKEIVRFMRKRTEQYIRQVSLRARLG